jgi:hypothetical protein
VNFELGTSCKLATAGVENELSSIADEMRNGTFKI